MKFEIYVKYGRHERLSESQSYSQYPSCKLPWKHHIIFPTTDRDGSCPSSFQQPAIHSDQRDLRNTIQISLDFSI